MDILLKTLLNSKKFGEYIKDIENFKLPTMLTGLTSVAKVQMMSATNFLPKKNYICYI